MVAEVVVAEEAEHKLHIPVEPAVAEQVVHRRDQV
jgi:hypothetical protein